jgi:hypothetical protein
MNDLERDLRELFAERARNAESPTLAPEQVLRRGRRREIRTVAMGVVASVVVIALALAVSNVVRTPVDTVPGGSQELPARSTTIGGVPVTAPAGWTLIDDTPAVNLIATSVACSFTAGGTEVDANGSPVASAPGPDPSVSCASDLPVSDSSSLAAGVPFLQLANFDVPLLEAVCASKGGSPTPLPADGVAVYAASFPSGMDSAALLDACPGSDRYAAATGGGNAYTFALSTGDGSTRLTMAAVGVAGPNASEADLSVARAFFDQPIFGQTNPSVALDPNRAGPGYVLAAGGNADAGWRLEAGVGSIAGDGQPMPGAILAIVENGEERSSTVRPAVGSVGTVETLDQVGDQVVQWGTVSGRFSGVEIDGPDGTVTKGDLYTWPQSVVEIADPRAFADPTSIWIATPPQEGVVRWVEAPTPTATPTQAPSSQGTPVGQLQTRTDANGIDQVIYGNDLGHDWELRQDAGELALSVDGTSYGSFPMVNGQWREYDVDGGSYIVGMFDNSVDRLVVARTPIGSTGVIVDGRFAVYDGSGEPGRLWFIPLEGTGSGTLRSMNDATPLGWHITWPSTTNLTSGSVLRAGGDGITYSWSLQWRDDRCAQLFWQTPHYTQIAGCLPPWSDLAKQGGTPLIGGQYASDPSGTSGIVLVLPAETSIASFSSNGDQPDPECITIQAESNFAGTGFCVFPLAVGSSATVTLDNNGDPLGGPFRIAAKPGRIELLQGDAVGPTPSTTP